MFVVMNVFLSFEMIALSLQVRFVFDMNFFAYQRSILAVLFAKDNEKGIMYCKETYLFKMFNTKDIYFSIFYNDIFVVRQTLLL